MKIFLSYRFTGEDPNQLKDTIRIICERLSVAGHKTFCSFWHGKFYNENKFTHKQILNHALNELKQSDVYLAFIRSEDKSEGMLMEAGYAIAEKKSFYLAIKKGVYTTFMREMADKVIEFETLDELYRALSKLK